MAALPWIFALYEMILSPVTKNRKPKSDELCDGLFGNVALTWWVNRIDDDKYDKQELGYFRFRTRPSFRFLLHNSRLGTILSWRWFCYCCWPSFYWWCKDQADEVLRQVSHFWLAKLEPSRWPDYRGIICWGQVFGIRPSIFGNEERHFAYISKAIWRIHTM